MQDNINNKTIKNIDNNIITKNNNKNNLKNNCEIIPSNDIKISSFTTFKEVKFQNVINCICDLKLNNILAIGCKNKFIYLYDLYTLDFLNQIPPTSLSYLNKLNYPITLVELFNGNLLVSYYGKCNAKIYSLDPAERGKFNLIQELDYISLSSSQIEIRDKKYILSINSGLNQSIILSYYNEEINFFSKKNDFQVNDGIHISQLTEINNELFSVAKQNKGIYFYEIESLSFKFSISIPNINEGAKKICKISDEIIAIPCHAPTKKTPSEIKIVNFKNKNIIKNIKLDSNNNYCSSILMYGNDLIVYSFDSPDLFPDDDDENIQFQGNNNIILQYKLDLKNMDLKFVTKIEKIHKGIVTGMILIDDWKNSKRYNIITCSVDDYVKLWK